MDVPGRVLARVQCVLQELLRLPAHDEVSVVAGASRVAHGEDELAVVSSEAVRGPDGLEEKEGVMGIVPLRAVAFLHQARVLHMTLVVQRVTRPVAATGERKLEAETILAVRIHVVLRRELVAVQRRFWVLSVVEAVETQSTLLKKELVARIGGSAAQVRVGERAGEVAGVLVARNHLKAFRERFVVVEVVQIVPTTN